MAGKEEFLRQLSPAIRQRIEADYDRYAPLLALLGAWKEDVADHVSQMEQNVVQRLTRELFPQGSWKFPAQTLAVPEDLANREVTEETLFTDRGTQTPWTPCGPGWTLPSRITDWKIEQQGWEKYALVCDIRLDSRQPVPRLLLPPRPPEDPIGQSQLAFVCGSEAIVEELSKAAWAVQHADEPFMPVSVSRYQGYLDFERGLGAARAKQRQLEAWMPPFYPYSRKFLRFYIGEEAPGFSPADWEWLRGGTTIRLAALISETTADFFERQHDQAPLLLNAIPVAQMRTLGEPLLENPDPVGDSFKVPFAGIKGCFAATLRQYSPAADGVKTIHQPCRLLTASNDNPRSRREEQSFEVWYDRPSSEAVTQGRVRIYFDTFGENARNPVALSRPGMRYQTPFPALGALDAPIQDYADAGSRRSWYHTLLRAPQLTLSDILEIVQQSPDCRKYLDLDPEYVSVQLDIENEPWVERSTWENYLWPCVIPDESLLERKATYLSRTQVAIIPVMRLIFSGGGERLPDFLADDLLQYISSLISRHFMLGWYRVTAKLSDGS